MNYLAECGSVRLPCRLDHSPLKLCIYCPSQATGQLALIPWPSSPHGQRTVLLPAQPPPSVLSNHPLPPGLWIFHPVTTVTGVRRELGVALTSVCAQSTVQDGELPGSEGISPVVHRGVQPLEIWGGGRNELQ